MYQLALLELMHTKLTRKSIVNQSYIFDPIHSIQESKYLREIGLQADCITDCHRCVRSRTVFLMIHCTKNMYESVLKANETSISNVVIIGNSFQSMGIECVREVPLAIFDDCLSAFNNTAIMFFDNHSI